MKPHPDAGKWFSFCRRYKATTWIGLGGPFEERKTAVRHANRDCPLRHESICGEMDSQGKLWLDLTTFEAP